jgi:hypothetical protein
MRLNKNNLYKMSGNDIGSTNDLISDDEKYFKSHEQISEVKYNIFMRIYINVNQ